MGLDASIRKLNTTFDTERERWTNGVQYLGEFRKFWALHEWVAYNVENARSDGRIFSVFAELTPAHLQRAFDEISVLDDVAPEHIQQLARVIDMVQDVDDNTYCIGYTGA